MQRYQTLRHKDFMIIKNVIALLQKDNSLYISNLGTFKNVLVSAKINDGQIEPPHYEIVFDEENPGNGFPLVMKIAEEEGLPLAAADDAINNWVSEIRKNLAQGEKFHIENLGTFFKKNDKIEFKSDFIPELNLEYEGMSPIEIVNSPTSKSKKKKKTGAVILIVLLGLLLGGGVAGYIFRDRLNPLAEKIISGKDKLQIKCENLLSNFAKEDELPGLSGTTTIAGWLEETYLPNVGLKEEEPDTTQIPFVRGFDVSTIEDKIIEVAIDEEPDVEIQTAESNATKETVRQGTVPSKDYPKINFESGKYYVIAGSLNSYNDAVAHAKAKESCGFKPQLLYQEGNSRIRICVAIFDNEEEAIKYRDNHTGLWILQ